MSSTFHPHPGNTRKRSFPFPAYNTLHSPYPVPIDKNKPLPRSGLCQLQDAALHFRHLCTIFFINTMTVTLCFDLLSIHSHCFASKPDRWFRCGFKMYFWSIIVRQFIMLRKFPLINLHTLRFYRIIVSHLFSKACI